MEISNKGIAFIGNFEAFIAKPYLDAVKVPTIGYGTTVYPSGKKVTMNDSQITIEQALAYKKWHIDHNIIPYIKNLSYLSQTQLDAIISLIYNIGIGNFNSSRLSEYLSKRILDCPTITKGFLGWTKGRINGVLKELKGLVTRRNKEAKLFCLGLY